MRFFAPADGICQVCKSEFHTRLRRLAHLCDSRRPKCRAILLNNPQFVSLSNDEVNELDEIDKVQRREATRQGHTHPIAKYSAKTKDGRVVGRVMA